MYYGEMQNRVIFEWQRRKPKGVSNNGGTLGGFSSAFLAASSLAS